MFPNSGAWKSPGEIAVRLLVLEEIRMGERRRGELAETFIVLPGHDQVDVIVPGDETLVPDGAEHRPRVGEPFQAILFANAGELVQQVQFHRPDSLHSGRNDKTVPLFLQEKGWIDMQFQRDHSYSSSMILLIPAV